MKGCSHCGKETEKLKMCPDCHKRFCLEHHKPSDHDCIGDSYLDENS